MSKKQTTGLIVAVVLFVVTGVISVVTNALSAKLSAGAEDSTDSFTAMMEEMYGTDDFTADDLPSDKDYIAVVPVSGTIQPSSSSSSLYASTDTYNHDLLMDYVNALIDSDCNKGIILRMDTPGGTVYESDELYLKLKEYKEKTGRPIWAYMESMCCSGGVYISSVADEQYANRNSTTGSIGVIMSSYNMAGLYEKLGIEEVNIVSSKNKDMGSAAKPLTAEQKAIYQSIVDESYEQFVGIVSEGRDMSIAEVKKLADGRIYTANQAVENGLIDGIMTSEEFDKYVKEESGIETFYELEESTDMFSQLFGAYASTKEKSEAEVLVDLMNSLGSGVPMYYAEPYGK